MKKTQKNEYFKYKFYYYYNNAELIIYWMNSLKIKQDQYLYFLFFLLIKNLIFFSIIAVIFV